MLESAPVVPGCLTTDTRTVEVVCALGPARSSLSESRLVPASLRAGSAPGRGPSPAPASRLRTTWSTKPARVALADKIVARSVQHG